MIARDGQPVPSPARPNPAEIQRAHEKVDTILPYLLRLLRIARHPEGDRPPEEDVVEGFMLLAQLYDDMQELESQQWWNRQVAAAYAGVHKRLGVPAPKLAAAAGAIVTSAHEAVVCVASNVLSEGWGLSNAHPSKCWHDLEDAWQTWFNDVVRALLEMREVDGMLLTGWVEQEHRLMRSAQAASPQKPLSAPAAATQPILRSDDVEILRALAQTKTTLNQYELESRIHISRKTISDRLSDLRQAGLVHRPHGERGGETITDAGRRELERHDAQATR